MDQLPLFLNLRGKHVVLVGDGNAADAKRRLIERAGGICVPDYPADTSNIVGIAYIALENEGEAIANAKRLRAKGMLVNVIDRPDLCDFTTPAIVDRAPVLIAVGTSGASASMAKAIRQRIEALLPQNLGALARAVLAARDSVKARWSEAAARRRALDKAFQPNGALDPFADHDDSAVASWLDEAEGSPRNRLVEIRLLSDDPDDLTLRTARLLGEVDHIFHDAPVPPAILERARADAVRHLGAPPETPPEGLSLYLRSSASR